MIKNSKISNNIKVLENPIADHYLSIIRCKNTDSTSFRGAIKILSNIVAINALGNLPTAELEMETPVCKTKCMAIDKNSEIFIVPILRAGLGISDSLLDLIPFAKIQHLGMCRNEKTLEPIWYYNKLPKEFKNAKNTFIYICDPMLATGGSIIEAIKLYIEKGIPEKNITTINIISAPEGLKKTIELFPNINIYTAAIDEKLNEKGYIVPGLGDAGDRIFNTIY